MKVKTPIKSNVVPIKKRKPLKVKNKFSKTRSSKPLKVKVQKGNFWHEMDLTDPGIG